MSSIFIPERFKREVFVHIFKNLWSDQLQSVPLILGIHGPSGWGKTFQCEYLLKSIGAKVFLLSGGQFESKDAGEPARLLRQTYRNAGSTILDKEADLAVLLINDIDTGLGNWGDDVQKTINTQTVFGELMHITDYPTIVNNQETPRIPIIVTGNDFTKLYSPLIRAGRMVAFEWIPTVNERVKIVDKIFEELTYRECKKLILELSSCTTKEGNTNNILNIAFFSHLRSTLYDDFIWAVLQQYGIEKILAQSLARRQPKLSAEINFSTVMEKSKKLITLSKYTNHLVGGK